MANKSGGYDLTLGGALPVRLRPPTSTPIDASFWTYIRLSTQLLEFKPFDEFLNYVLCGSDELTEGCAEEITSRREALRSCGIQSTNAYQLLKTATECYLMHFCGCIDAEAVRSFSSISTFEDDTKELIATRDSVLQQLKDQLNGDKSISPWIDRIVSGLTNANIQEGVALGNGCYGLPELRVSRPCAIELIWSYWTEQSLMVQLINAISMRFQNRRTRSGTDPLANLTLSPLRPLNNLMWGYVQDEQHRLSVPRRAYEYDHHYGLTLLGKAVPETNGVDSRTKFIGAFHQLLHICSEFYLRVDDMTIQADGFPVLNALKEVHLLLAEGADNQYGDLPWTARVEMMIQQWLIGREEMREFLSVRPMMPYPEPWMGRVDTYKRMLNVTDPPCTHYRELAVFGERILLTVRHNDWSNVTDRNIAAEWAKFFRGEIQAYIHSYRAVTGVDLTRSPVDTRSPSTLLRGQAVRAA